MAKNLGSVYMYKMIEKIYFVKVKNFVVFIALTLVLVVGGCSDSDSISDSPKIQDYLESLGLKDFLLVRSKGQSVLLGSQMESAFDYDFLIVRIRCLRRM